ncbi:hypothetical protein [Sorangium sp. So ce1000]|uniref:hypothetical protein n=1 Tax=Sorangium sp. So ce1000 TaxID=3133325 RepID=UPI003F6389BF
MACRHCGHHCPWQHHHPWWAAPYLASPGWGSQPPGYGAPREEAPGPPETEREMFERRLRRIEEQLAELLRSNRPA